MPEVVLNVADIRLQSQVNGPGLRSVVWVKGCTIGCPGCFNPHTHPHTKKHLFDAEKVGRFLAQVPDTDGITISGGEPFEQAEACAVLAAAVRSSGRSVMVFTGYRFEYLQESTEFSVKRFLATIDLLVAGPYVERLRSSGALWRGSTNQTVHLLTGRLAKAVHTFSASGPVVEATADGNGLSLTGFPDSQDRCWLERLAQVSCARPSGSCHRENKTEVRR